jgi:hypothetical protein
MEAALLGGEYPARVLHVRRSTAQISRAAAIEVLSSAQTSSATSDRSSILIDTTSERRTVWVVVDVSAAR